MPDDPAQRAARYRAGVPEERAGAHGAETEDANEDEDGADASAPARGRRPEDQALWVEVQIRTAIDRGDFDDLPLAGKPLPRRLMNQDRDWWVKQLVEREQITGVLPPALGLRREDAELDDLLDTTGSEERVREILADFNRRVVEARRQLQGGPPVITAPRDVEADVERWHARRRARAVARAASVPAPVPRRRWWRRGR